MATGGVTVTGLREMRANVRAFPRTLSLALRGVAASTAGRVRVGAQQRLAAQTHGTGQTAASLVVVEDAPRQQFRIEGTPVRGRSENVLRWLEFGTVHMSARPSLGPALEAESVAYVRACEATVQRYGTAALGG